MLRTPTPGAALMLERLRAVEWDMRWDLAFARLGSRRVLMWEYLRRAAVWARACGADGVWPFFDVTPCVDPGFELGAEQAAGLAELLLRVPGAELRRTCEGAVRFAELRARRPDAVDGLPDPYEPLVLFYERGGSFGRDCATSALDLVGASYRPGPLRGFLGGRPVAVLDDAVLDALDLEGRVTYYAPEGVGGALVQRHARGTELLGPDLRWCPTDRDPEGEEGLVRIDLLEAARRIGRAAQPDV
ncbi:hypothetical protein [Streptomyces sp. NPDC127112]|uniref:hypothetical protein n=1 Tax=Streptomyces sp. NPDC127112 TaxID=3345364 RepID=UPI003635237E